MILDDDYKTIKPNLVEKWDISNDGYEYSFYLKPNIKFHDGTNLTSDDVKSSFIWQNKNLISLGIIIDEITIVDSLTISIRLENLNSTFFCIA